MATKIFPIFQCLALVPTIVKEAKAGFPPQQTCAAAGFCTSGKYYFILSCFSLDTLFQQGLRRVKKDSLPHSTFILISCNYKYFFSILLFSILEYLLKSKKDSYIEIIVKKMLVSQNDLNFFI